MRLFPKKALLHLDQYLRLGKETAREWDADNVVRHSAALSFYTLFSLAPLLIIAIAVASMIFGREASEGRVVDHLQSLLGRDSALAVQTMIHSAWKPGTSWLSAILGSVALLVGASGVLIELKSGLRHIWKVPEKTTGWRKLLFSQTLSYAFLLGIGFLLLVSLLVSSALAAANHAFIANLPFPNLVLKVLGLVLDLGMTLFIFGAIFKWLPDAKMNWRDVWTGAAFTSLLFIAGKTLLALYLGKSGISSTYGSAGSLIVILLWVYYSAVIFYTGAEFTKVYAKHYGAQS